MKKIDKEYVLWTLKLQFFVWVFIAYALYCSDVSFTTYSLKCYLLFVGCFNCVMLFYWIKNRMYKRSERIKYFKNK